MNTKVFMILRIVLGVFILAFGLNKFLKFLPDFEIEGDALAYFTALVNSKTMDLVAVIEIVAGLALITNKFGALMSLILMSVSVNAVLFHAVLDPANIGGALVLLALNAAVLFGYKDKYKDLLAG